MLRGTLLWDGGGDTYVFPPNFLDDNCFELSPFLHTLQGVLHVNDVRAPSHPIQLYLALCLILMITQEKKLKGKV